MLSEGSGTVGMKRGVAVESVGDDVCAERVMSLCFACVCVCNSRATVNVGIKKILLLYSSHLGPSVED